MIVCGAKEITADMYVAVVAYFVTLLIMPPSQ